MNLEVISFYFNIMWGILHILTLPRYKAGSQIVNGLFGAILIALGLAGLLQ